MPAEDRTAIYDEVVDKMQTQWIVIILLNHSLNEFPVKSPQTGMAWRREAPVKSMYTRLKNKQKENRIPVSKRFFFYFGLSLPLRAYSKKILEICIVSRGQT